MHERVCLVVDEFSYRLIRSPGHVCVFALFEAVARIDFVKCFWVRMFHFLIFLELLEDANLPLEVPRLGVSA
jgi:hypothetical protein